MIVWVLKKHPNTENLSDKENPWEPWYDTCTLQIVIALSRNKARKLASNQPGDEGAEVWLNPDLTTCKRLNVLKSHVAAREVSWA